MAVLAVGARILGGIEIHDAASRDTEGWTGGMQRQTGILTERLTICGEGKRTDAGRGCTGGVGQVQSQ
jgi:hypothetical protein